MSSLPYVQQLSKVIVAQITQTIGWNSIQTTPLELLTDILHKYLEELTRQTQRYTELYGRTEPNLDDVALAFNDLNINIADLEEYITNVDPVPCIINVPKFPISKESNLNFLKPGSKEVVTRPVHIHEHLPPIQPHEETPPAEPARPTVESNDADEHNSTNIIQTYISTNQISDNPSNGVYAHGANDEIGETINVIGETTIVAENNNTADSVTTTTETFKKPFDAPQSQSRTVANGNGDSSAANTNATHAIGKPTREIISCFMTTGGFISPAREGKLPDAKKPIIIPEDPEPEPVPIKQRTPTPEPVVVVERKHHSSKRDREIKAEPSEAPTSKNHGNDATNARQNDLSPYDDFHTDGKEVKLYEVIQTVPDPPLPKKKTKKQLNMAHLKEQKKLKKLSQLKANRNALKFGSDNASHPFSAGDFAKDNQAMDAIHSAEKIKKKLHKMEALKQKKRKQKQLIGMGDAGNNDQLLTAKQHKKRIAKLDKQHKLSKKNLQAMGLNPNAIEGFAIVPSMDGGAKFPPDHEAADPIQISMKLNTPQKEGKKNKKLSNEPDKQKIKFFKKLSTTSSNLLSKSESREHDIDRTMADASSNLSGIDVNNQVTAHSFDGDGFGGDGSTPFARTAQFELNRLPPDLEGLPPSKKQKLLKKLNKPPKEPKPPKIKKLKKDGLPRKERTPKAAKMLDNTSNEMAKPFAPAGPADENPLSKMFIPEFRPNVGIIPGEFPMPGLNPLNPLFQSVRFDLPGRDPMQNYPFPMQNFNFVDFSRFKRPNFNDPIQNDGEPSVSSKYARDINNPPPKPLCNVAPLMPPSLLQMEMHQRAELSQRGEMPNPAMKHYPHEVANSGYGSKKSLPYSNPNEQYPEQMQQSFAGHSHGNNDSPIVIYSDDDDCSDKMRNNRSNRSNPSQSPSPGPGPEQSFDDGDGGAGGGGSSEGKRKKVKDKKDKEKKEKKDKDTGIVKLKKKKDKKDKSKSKGDHSKPPKDKSALKKEKREKKKERERSAAALSMDTNDSVGATSNSFYGSQSHSEWPRDTFSKPDHGHFHGDSSDVNATFNTDNSNLETSAIPKLTLKLAPSSSSPSSRTSRPSTPDIPVTKKGSKKKKKQWRTMDDDSDRSDADDNAAGISKTDEISAPIAREPSPEMARISALITRPPKQKSSKQQQNVEFNSPMRNEYFDATAPRNDYHSSVASSTPIVAAPSSSGRGRPKGSSSSKGSKKSSKASTTFSVAAASTIESDKKSQSYADNQSAIADAQINLSAVDEQANEEENQVWICPACGRVDDGTPMIGCDGCDDWYHWVCVGILVPPKEDQDWFCRVCISRKQEDKKKKRKKKDKKDH